MSHTMGRAGIAASWRGSDGVLRYAAVIDWERDGECTYVGTLGEREDVAHTAHAAWRGSARRPERDTLALLFPYVGKSSPASAAPGLPSIGEHAALARRALAEASLPPAMRDALTDCMDVGVSGSVPLLAKLRLATHATLWPTLALSVTDPWLVDAVAVAEPSLLQGNDPLAAIRRRWPGLTPAHLARMRRQDAFPRSCRGMGKASAENCMDLLAASPADWWPGRDAWTEFLACAHTLRAIRDAYGHGGTLQDLAMPSKGDWAAFLDRLRAAAGLDRPGAPKGSLADRGANCADPIRSMATTLTLPLLATGLDDGDVTALEEALGRVVLGEGDPSPVVERAADVAGRLIYGDKSAVAILETSRDWHARHKAIDSRIRTRKTDVTWPALYEGAFHDGRVGIVPVASQSGLRAEGSAGHDADGVPGLDHCVATRLAECLSGRAHVLSVRLFEADGSWRRLSTCEVGLRFTERGDPRIDLIEHKGQGNVDPDPVAEEAFSRLRDALAAGTLSVSEAVLAPCRPSRSLEDVCGYDWRDPDAIANAVEGWRPFLPRWSREFDPADMARALAERGLLPEGGIASVPASGMTP